MEWLRHGARGNWPVYHPELIVGYVEQLLWSAREGDGDCGESAPGLRRGPCRAVLRLELIRATGLPSWSLSPVLARLARAGWVRSSREQVDPAVERRPARRYYELTPDGLAAA